MSNLTLSPAPLTFQQATDALGSRDSMKIGHNTRLERRGADVYATYHGNDIVRYSADGVFASWAGWATSTTSNRLNKLTQGRFNIYKGEPQINGVTLTGSWSEWHKVG